MKKFEVVGLTYEELEAIIVKHSGAEGAYADRDKGRIYACSINGKERDYLIDLDSYVAEELGGYITMFAADGDQHFPCSIMIITKEIGAS